MTDYLLCGWHVWSAILLPELPLWPGDLNDPDVAIVREFIPVPPTDASPIHIEDDGTVSVTIPGVGRFLVSDGRRIAIQPHLPLDEAGIRLYLLGTVLAILCYQRGLVPLHGSCFVPEPGGTPRAVIVSGDSGVGKSTLAATLALRGAPILADDVCVLDISSPAGPFILPSVARLKLWRDSLDRLDIPVETLQRVRDGLDKYAWYDVPAVWTDPMPLAAVYHLTRAPETSRTPEPLHPVSGIAAVELLSSCVYRARIGIALGQEALIAKTLMTILASAPIFRLFHDPDTDTSNRLPELLLEHWNTIACR